MDMRGTDKKIDKDKKITLNLNIKRGGETKVMKKFNKKMINVVTTAALVASLAAPFAASAATDSRVSEVPTFSDDKDGAVLGTLTFKEDSDYPTDLQNGTITLTFPAGAKVKSVAVDGGTATIVGDYTVNIKVTGATGAVDTLNITPTVDIDGFSGSAIEVDVQSFGAGVPSGKYKLANIANGDTITTALNTKTIGEDGGDLGTIRIEETSVGKIEAGDEITVKLPKGFEFIKADTDIDFLGGMASTLKLGNVEVDGRTLTFTVEEIAGGTTSSRGYIQITPNVDVDTDEAKFGEISVEVSGDNVDSKDVVVGTYSDYAVTVAVDGDAAELLAGRDNSDKDDQKLAKLQIKEGVKDSLTPGRKTKVEFPAWVKITGVEVKDAKGIDASALQSKLNALIAAADEADEQSELEFEIVGNSSTTKVDFKLQFYVSVQADKAGDIEASVTGRQGVEGKAVLGKAVAPVSVSATSNKVVIGKKDQAVGDITIKEAVKGAIIEGEDLIVELPDDVEWNNKGTIEVVEGDLELDTKNIDKEDHKLIIPIKNESTKASTIKISGGTIDIDRTVAEGALNAKIKGEAVVENNDSDEDTAGKFDASKVTQVEVATVATPAPGTVYANATFTIDSTKYTVNGVDKTADVAPFIQDGRTFLPVRFVAEAVGVSESNIIFNANTKTVTLIKGDRVAQIQIGSKNLVVNGVTVPMDTVATIKDGRTVLPLRFVAQALGAEVTWDEATRTVNVK